MATANKEKGVIKEKPLMDILNRKVELKKELIQLKKDHEDTKKQEAVSYTHLTLPTILLV